MARKQTFEAGMSELEALTERLAEGDMTLDETIKTYEKGVALAAAEAAACGLQQAH